MARPRRKPRAKTPPGTVVLSLKKKNAINAQLRKAERGLAALTATVRALGAVACSANFMKAR